MSGHWKFSVTSLQLQIPFIFLPLDWFYLILLRIHYLKYIPNKIVTCSSSVLRPKREKEYLFVISEMTMDLYINMIFCMSCQPLEQEQEHGRFLLPLYALISRGARAPAHCQPPNSPYSILKRNAKHQNSS